MLIPKGTYGGELTVKKSRFICHALPVSSTEEVKAYITHARLTHPQANHVVHAYILGRRGDIFGMSDDHEPRNTAGRPVLEVLKGSKITNILILVIRYFGGTKLGTGGLVKAYGESAKLALSGLETEVEEDKRSFMIMVPYQLYEQVKLMLQAHQAEVESEVFETEVAVKGMVPEHQSRDLEEALQEISSGSLTLGSCN